MALTYQPPFTQIPNIGVQTLSAANAARDGSGTIPTGFTAGSDGSFVKRIKFIPAQATAAAAASTSRGRSRRRRASKAAPGAGTVRASGSMPAAKASSRSSAAGADCVDK